MNSIKGFTFYQSYYESLKDFSKKDREEMLISIVNYVFEDKEPKLSGIRKAVWILIKPNLDCSKHKASNAKKENQIEIKSKSNENQIEINHLYDKEGRGGDKDKELIYNNNISNKNTNNKEINNNRNKEREDVASATNPALADILIFGTSLGSDKKYCEKFYNHYESVGWVNGGGNKIKNWKLVFKNWLEEDSKKIVAFKRPQFAKSDKGRSILDKAIEEERNER